MSVCVCVRACVRVRVCVFNVISVRWLKKKRGRCILPVDLPLVQCTQTGSCVHACVDFLAEGYHRLVLGERVTQRTNEDT